MYHRKASLALCDTLKSPKVFRKKESVKLSPRTTVFRLESNMLILTLSGRGSLEILTKTRIPVFKAVSSFMANFYIKYVPKVEQKIVHMLRWQNNWPKRVKSKIFPVVAFNIFEKNF